MTTAAQKSLATSTTGTACADSDSTEFVRDEQYWFDDGNVVIVAQNIGFRIYQGHLSSVSSVFNKMFDPKHAVSMYAEDGCLAISITDTATEFRALLRVLLRSTRSMNPLTYAFDDIVKCAQMAHKYHIPSILSESLPMLRMYFPAKFHDWEKRPSYSPRARVISVVNLARLANIPSILPAALYDCCQLDGAALLRGVKRADGTTEQLTPEDLARCINGKVSLCVEHVKMHHKLFQAPLSSDHPYARCTQAAEKCVARYRANGCTDVFDIRLNIFALNVCSKCLKELRGRLTSMKEDTWGRLPELLGID